MSFAQTQFLNSSVIGWNCSIGWGDTASQLTVSLVDDPLRNESFNPGYVGKPTTFKFGGFEYTGIIQSYHQTDGTGGFTSECTITDPRDILDGVQIILDGYIGSVSSIYNILNVYGYLESFGFGSSQKNETGIPWKLIRDSVQALTSSSQQGIYGGPIYYIQSRYIVQLTGLPNLPDDFRVGSDSISLLQFITEVCEAGGCDFFITMTEATTGIFVINVNTVSRSALINYGAITQYISSFPEYENKEAGFELTNETTSKFLVGGSIRELWYQYEDGSVNSIWPFWGYDINGNPIIGTGYGDDHTFVLDSRAVPNPNVGPFYQTNVAELRAVLAGRASWETFLILNRGNKGIHSKKADQLKISGYMANGNPIDIIQEFVNNYNNNGLELVLDPGKKLFPHVDQFDEYGQHDAEIGYLYSFLSHIATEYYGKKFMIAIPFTYSAEEPDTGKIRLSQLPVDSGYIEESLWPVGIQRNLLPLEIDRVTDEDGKIVGFCRFDNGDLLDISELSPDSVSFNSRQETYGKNKLRNISIFVRCEIEESVVFLNKNNKFGPRAIITLDGPVRKRVVDGAVPGKELLVKFLKEGFSVSGIDVTTQDFQKNVIDKFLGYGGQDVFNYGNEAEAVSPNLAVVPLESQVKFYGPWYAAGVAGKVDYEKDDTLVPWNYGGFKVLNIAAESKVNQAIGSNFQLEQGSITFPGNPFHNLGEPLINGGPIISDISVNIGTNGINTTYRFRRNVKQPRYGQARAVRLTQLAKRAQQIRRNLRTAQAPKRRANLARTAVPIQIVNKNEHPKNKKTSSHEVLVGQVFTNSSGNMNSSVFLQADYNFIGHVKYDYENKGFMSLDGLYVPFSTAPKSGYPSFVFPSGNQTSPTVDELNPFPSSNIKVVARGSGLPNDLYQGYGSYRPIALRGPLVIGGWGYDTEGYPVPNQLVSGQKTEIFHSDYKTDMSKWKVGPLAVPWDEERGVWAADGNGGGLIRGVATSFLPIGTLSSGTANLVSSSGNITIFNWVNQPICSGDRVFLSKEGNRYYVVQSQFKPLSVVSNIICSGGSINTQRQTIYLPSSYTTISGTFLC